MFYKSANKAIATLAAAILALALAIPMIAATKTAIASSSPIAPATINEQAKKTGIKPSHVQAKNLVYTGKSQKPKVSVKVKGKTLKRGKHYTLTIKNSKGKRLSKVRSIGTYTAIVKGRGSYKNTVTKKFKVAARKTIRATNVRVSNPTYYGNWMTPHVVVSTGQENDLREGKDYTVTLFDSNGTKLSKVKYVGAYTAVIKGKGAYKGTVKQNFKVNARRLESSDVYVSSYNRSAVSVPGVPGRFANLLDTGKSLDMFEAEAIHYSGYQIDRLAFQDNVDSYVTFESADTSIATVNTKGVIKGERKGITKITVRWKSSKKKLGTLYVKVRTANYKAKYSYKLYTIKGTNSNDFYSGYSRWIYVKTDNPDPTTIGLTIDNEMVMRDGPSSCVDIKYTYDKIINHRSNFFGSVAGGYVTCVYTENAGRKSLELWEFEDYEEETNTHAVGAKANISVIDTSAAAERFMQNVLNASTTPDMDPTQKLNAVANTISSSFQYNFCVYDEDSGNGFSYAETARECAPYFIDKRIDSALSPSLLCKFAKRIGGFEEIHDCYSDYPYGSSEWKARHYYCYVTYKGETRYYQACPSPHPVNADEVKLIDFSSIEDLVAL